MLEVRRLSVSYGARQAVCGVDLEVARGEVVGLVGPNGCGKTSLLQAITSSLTASSGAVFIDGKPAAAMAARELALLVAVVPQSPRLPVGYSARDVVLMGRTAHLGFLEQESALDRQAVEDALALLDAEALADREVQEMSGGERQNVVIARALAQAAPLLLLDEPTANLDIGHQIAIARMLRRLASQEGKGVLMAVHDLTLASLYCDRLLLMADGRVLATGTPAEVLTNQRLAQAYGVDVALLTPQGLPGPVVLPLRAEPKELARSPGRSK